jgi:sugar lactone lactonase YvrE
MRLVAVKALNCCALVLALLVAAPPQALAQVYAVSTVAGDPQAIGDGGPATAAQLYFPVSLAFDGKRNLFIGDLYGQRIRVVNSSGTISTAAGSGTWGIGGDRGPATAASLTDSRGLAVDSSGNLYITNVGTISNARDGAWYTPNTSNIWWIVTSGAARIRRVDPNGVISTLTGTGSGYRGDGGPATAALLDNPRGLAVDASGNLYIADTDNHAIRRVTANGIITTVAGTGDAGFAGDGGPATAAKLNNPVAVAVDAAGNIYIADSSNYRVRRVTPAGMIDTVAGTGSSGFTGDNGPATAARLGSPRALAVDPAGNIYVGERYRVRRISAAGIIVSVAGTGERGFSGDGGRGEWAQLDGVWALAVDGSGDLYIADSSNSRVRQLSTNGIISTLAGGGDVGGGGPAAAARLNTPNSLAFDASGNAYVSDRSDCRVRKITPAAVISTIAGSGATGFAGDGGPATAAKLDNPKGITTDASGSLYVADTGNHRIRQVTSTGGIRTIVGAGSCGFSGDYGPAPGAELCYPSDVKLGPDGMLYIADTNNHRVRRTTPGGVIVTVVGNGIAGSGGDGGAAPAANLHFPQGIAFDAAGNLYIADTNNYRIRRVAPAGLVSTIAGAGTYGCTGDGGPATAAKLSTPTGVEVDSVGNIYIADYMCNRVRRVTPDGTITTIAGTGTFGFEGDGGPAANAFLGWPSDVAVDASGGIWFADTSTMSSAS